MAKELISIKIRTSLRELLVGWVLREIATEFESAGIQCDSSYIPPEVGQRRSSVEQYYHTLDFANANDARRFLSVLESVLNKQPRKLVDQPDQKTQRNLDELIGLIRANGFGYNDGKISMANSVVRRAFIEASGHSISEVTRRNIVDTIQAEGIRWAGRLDQDTFLGRLYDLDSLPSYDNRCKTAGGDIHQHTVMNQDWDAGWVFSDARFGLMHSDDASFLRFLCEMVHPIARPDEAEVLSLVKIINDLLAKDGWNIFEADSISGKPVFKAQQGNFQGFVAQKHISVLAEKMDLAHIAKLTARMTESVDDDPDVAIGSAKELVESVCKTILQERGIPYSKNADVLELNKATLKALHLVPDDIPEFAKGADIIKRMLSNLGSVTQGLAELRGLYGTGHGKHGKTKSVHPRHARLAVGASSTLASFLYETHLHNKAS